MRSTVVSWAIVAIVTLVGARAMGDVLVNVGQQELIVLDARVNGDSDSGATQQYSPWSQYMPISVTAGEYEIQFVNTVPDRIAWNPNGEWIVGLVGIFYQDRREYALNVGVLGGGSTVADAWASATQTTLFFSVAEDQTLRACVKDWYLADNSGGNAFIIEKVAAPVPLPAALPAGLAALGGLAGLRAWRRTRKTAQIRGLCLACLAAGLAVTTLGTGQARANVMTFEGIPAGQWFPPPSFSYTEDGIAVSVGQAAAISVGDPLGWCPTNCLYFHGTGAFARFTMADGSAFDLVSLDLADNGYAPRYLTTSAGASVEMNAGSALRAFTPSGPGYTNLSWFEVTTPWYATQLDNITVNPASAVPLPAAGWAGAGLLGLLGLLRLWRMRRA